MVAVTIGGSVLGVLVLMAVGDLPPAAFMSSVLGSMCNSVIVTRTFGRSVATSRGRAGRRGG